MQGAGAEAHELTLGSGPDYRSQWIALEPGKLLIISDIISIILKVKLCVLTKFAKRSFSMKDFFKLLIKSSYGTGYIDKCLRLENVMVLPDYAISRF